MIKDTYVYATKTNLSLIIGDFLWEKPVNRGLK